MKATLVPFGLEIAARCRPLLSRLPMAPPAQLLASSLNRLLLPRLPRDAREALSNRRVAVEVTDLGLSLGIVLGAGGFGVAGAGPAVLRIAAAAPSFWRLLAGQDDADRLFFERQLVMEGDTEMALVLKNTLDAIGPLWG
ncbi:MULTISPECIES: SCP2 domain-containing protein [unclassified Rhizobacter]|uniref:ubiquinone anaerobic biosynthesis accessory factor UbiT n=1 Tax=unclassified Rhizobacter TaxID=2640088 RepID=UPI0006F88A9C|nr:MULTISPECIES: SCP2 sterol-binding domain-containing protein [unclassified Rhizobacter]KQU67294.1 sterol-binding protein [Rhizobacter sp. Root29]KQW14561.1 sterol-binding protein [Rhizobacter sp. Root1238]KRB23916.1 sterol-binding protein [Rhizobacter sp. Root16D2]